MTDYRSLGAMLNPQYYLPQGDEAAGNWPSGYFSGGPSTLWGEMVRRTEAAQDAPSQFLNIRYNPEAYKRFMAEAPRSTNIEQGPWADVHSLTVPDWPPAMPTPEIDENNPLAIALGIRNVRAQAPFDTPLPRRRPR
jgi:hypothetical protein